MRADIHDGPEHMLQSEAGYIDARPLTPARQNLLQRTAGPYMWVNRVVSAMSALSRFTPVNRHRQLDRPLRKNAKGLNRSRGRALRLAARPVSGWERPV